MSEYLFKTEQFLPIGISQAWNFFSSPKNLALITPPDLDFKIVTIPDESNIYEGMIIDYKVRPLLGIRVNWKTEIFDVQKPVLFSDRQIKGPYRLWEHKHVFIEKDNGILMTDEVRYRLPFSLLGRLTHFLVVRRKIEKIFAYRRNILQKIFINE